MGKIATVTFARSALTDIMEMRVWYAEQLVPEIGERLAAEIIARVETLQLNPDMGRMVPEFDAPAIRELIHPPFRIVYLCEPDKVRIVRVWRSERLMKLP